MATRLCSVNDILTKNPSIFDGRSDRQVLAHLQENWQSLGMVKCPDSLGQIPNVRKSLGICLASARNTGGERKAPAVPTGLSSEFISALKNAHALGGLRVDYSQCYQDNGPTGQKYNAALIAELRERLTAAPLDPKFTVPFTHVRDADWKLLGLETRDMRQARIDRETTARAQLDAEISALRNKGYTVTTAPAADDHEFIRVGDVTLTVTDYTTMAEHFAHGGYPVWDSSDLGPTIARATAERMERERLEREAQAEQARQAANHAAQQSAVAVATIVAGGDIEDARIAREEAAKELAARDARIAAMEAKEAEMKEELERLRAAAIAPASTQPQLKVAVSNRNRK